MEDANRLPRQPAANTRELLKNTLGMAWPAVLESFFIALAGMIDVKMVSNLGSYAVAAVGLTTQPKFLGLAFFIATNVALSALVARRLGENGGRTPIRSCSPLWSYPSWSVPSSAPSVSPWPIPSSTCVALSRTPMRQL